MDRFCARLCVGLQAPFFWLLFGSPFSGSFFGFTFWSMLGFCAACINCFSGSLFSWSFFWVKLLTLRLLCVLPAPDQRYHNIFLFTFFWSVFLVNIKFCSSFVCRPRQIDAHPDHPGCSGQRARHDACARDASGAAGADRERRLGFFGVSFRVSEATCQGRRRRCRQWEPACGGQRTCWVQPISSGWYRPYQKGCALLTWGCSQHVIGTLHRTMNHAPKLHSSFRR